MCLCLIPGSRSVLHSNYSDFYDVLKRKNHPVCDCMAANECDDDQTSSSLHSHHPFLLLALSLSCFLPPGLTGVACVQTYYPETLRNVRSDDTVRTCVVAQFVFVFFILGLIWYFGVLNFRRFGIAQLDGAILLITRFKDASQDTFTLTLLLSFSLQHLLDLSGRQRKLRSNRKWAQLSWSRPPTQRAGGPLCPLGEKHQSPNPKAQAQAAPSATSPTNQRPHISVKPYWWAGLNMNPVT